MSRFGREAEAYFLAVGTIVGVGMFGIPFVFAKAGFLTGILVLLVLTGVVSLVHLCFADVVLEVGTKHRLPGYVSHFFGRIPGFVSLILYLFGLSGSLLAYLVLGGAFLGALVLVVLPSAPPLAGHVLFYSLGVGIMLKGIRFEGFANGVLTCALVAAILLFGVFLGFKSDAALLATLDPFEFFTPYGVLLFSLAGAAIIPDMSVILGRENRRSLRIVVLAGTVTAAILYVVFATAVVGVTGGETTPDAVRGIASVLGNKFLIIGALIGFLASITSFIPLGTVLKEVLAKDVGVGSNTAWVLTIGFPLLLFFLGFQNFIAIISVIGALGIGIDSIFILAMHRRLSRAHALHVPLVLSFVLALMFAAGMVIEIMHIL